MATERIHGHTVYTPILGRDPVVLDLGANRGGFSEAFVERFGGSAFLVEANPSLASFLREQKRFPVAEHAVCDRNGPVAFHVARNDEGSSLLTLPEQNAYDCVLVETVEVAGRTIDSLIEHFELDHIDLVKMDVEGAEVQALGTLSTETMRNIGQITVEFHSDVEFGFDIGEAVEDVIKRLQELGFLFWDFSGETRRDVLFVNRRAVPLPSRIKWSIRSNPPSWLKLMWKRLPQSIRGRLNRDV
ncbi:MAG: FkbM family methyltransferase [Isosphaeraceae bacterium]